MKKTLSVILISLLLTGCQFSKSVKKDLISGLTTTGNVLTCNDVYLSINNERTTRNSFNYGEIVNLEFSDIKGFTKENGNVFPLMNILVTDKSGDTVLFTDDLYSEYPDGLNFSPLKLTADLTVAAPMHSDENYTLSVNIGDKKGPGTYISKLNFTVKSNDKIRSDPKGVTYDEIYLYSKGKEKVITDGKIDFDDNIYILVEGLKGFKEDNGLVFPGLSLSAVDSEKNPVLKNDDLFSEYTETGVALSDFSSRVSAQFKISGTVFSNPLTVEIIIWDKKSDSRLIVSTDFELE